MCHYVNMHLTLYISLHDDYSPHITKAQIKTCRSPKHLPTAFQVWF